MTPAVLLRNLDRVLLSTLAGKAPTDTNLTTVRTGKALPLLNKLHNTNSNLGHGSVEAGPGGVEGDGVPTLVFPNQSYISRILKPYQKLLPKRGFTQSRRKVGSRKSGCQVIPGLLQSTLSCPNTKQKMETNLGSKSVELIPEDQYLQNGNSGDNPVILTGRGVGNFTGLQRHVFPHSNQPEVKKVSEIFPEQPNLSVHSFPLWFGHSSPRVYKGGQKSETDGTSQDIRIHQYLDDWLVRAPCRETCLQHTQILLALCQQLGLVVNMKKSELQPQQGFNFVGYRFKLLSGRVLPTRDRWIALQEKLNFIKNQSSYTVRQIMSLIALLTATEKQVWAGRLLMRRIQWDLKCQ